jgi:hypothetical protein
MVWFRRKPSASPVPYKWTQELWAEAFFGTGTRFEAFIPIAYLNKCYELDSEYNRPAVFTATANYSGRLNHNPSSPLYHCYAKLDFVSGLQIPDETAVGAAFTQDGDSVYKTSYSLVIRVLEKDNIASEFEAAFHRGKASGQDFISLWISGKSRASPMTDYDGFSCIQPLSIVRFQQETSLIAKSLGGSGH